VTDSYLDTNGERQPYYEPRAPRPGGYFEDETGWWCLDSVGDDGICWLIGRNGAERDLALADLPELTYCED